MRSSAVQDSVSIPPPPPTPPPPPSAGRKRRTGLWVTAFVLIAILVVASLFYFGIFPWPFETPQKGVEGVTITSGTPVQVTSQSVNPGGGTIEVMNSSSSLFGLKIEVPEAAASEAINFNVGYSDVVNVTGLPKNASVVSKLIHVETLGSSIWNEYKTFDIPVTVTLPYDPSTVSDEDLVRFYRYDSQDKILVPAGFLWEDTTNHTVTFITLTFSSSPSAIDWIGIHFPIYSFLMEQGQANFALATRFFPPQDGWFMPNHGSYLTPGGYCMGMVNYAKWYYRHKVVEKWQEDDPEGIPVYCGGGYWDTRPGMVQLRSKYKEGDPSSWLDDATAIQIAARAQVAAEAASKAVEIKRVTVPSNWLSKHSWRVAGTWLHGMYITHEPQLVGLFTVRADGKFDKEGHMVLAYKYSNGLFDIYDPNYPATHPGSPARQIPFLFPRPAGSGLGGFNQTYKSGSVTGVEREFNVFEAFGDELIGTKSFYSDLFDAAEKKFADDTLFPRVKLTDASTTPQGMTPIDTNGDGIRDTEDSSCTISGTISGEMPPGERVNATWILYPSIEAPIRVPVVDGSFSHKAPLLQGDNEVIILAAGWHSYRKKWAGFLKETIKCTATLANLTFTLTWDQDNSDVDLHVLEPTIEGIEGRHIYYSNKGEAGGEYPYLDFDDTSGIGPEHYIGTTNMTLPNYPGPGKSLYGTYKVRVHYYADHDDNPNQTQTITWHLTVKCLRFLVLATNHPVWLEIAWHGSLSSASSAGTSDFLYHDPSWSNVYVVNFTEPDPESLRIPPPPQNKLPR